MKTGQPITFHFTLVIFNFTLLQTLKKRNRLSLLHRDDRLLPVARLALRVAADAPLLALDVQGVDFDDVYLEDALDGVANLDLIRILGYAEGVLAMVAQVHALLSQQRPLDHEEWIFH